MQRVFLSGCFDLMKGAHLRGRFVSNFRFIFPCLEYFHYFHLFSGGGGCLPPGDVNFCRGIIDFSFLFGQKEFFFEGVRLGGNDLYRVVEGFFPARGVLVAGIRDHAPMNIYVSLILEALQVFSRLASR